MRIGRLVLFLVMICGAVAAVSAHSNFILHGEDVMSVMGLKNDTRLFSRSRDSKKNNSWVKFISSDMIDNTAFHKELESDYPGLSINGPRRHRMLFHWAYDTKPWNIGVELLMTEYCEVQDLNVESNLRVLRAKLVTEQRRRNKLIITRTQEVFGFDKGGRAERIYTRFFCLYGL